MPEPVKLYIKLVVEIIDPEITESDVLEVLDESLENFQYSIGVRKVNVFRSEPKVIN